MPEIQPLLRQAAQAIKSGDKRNAGKLIAQILKIDPRNADAYYLASFVEDKAEKRIVLLERAMQINPQHIRAKEALDKLRDPLADLFVTVSPQEQTQPKKRSTGCGSFLLFIIIVAGALWLLQLNSGKSISQPISVKASTPKPLSAYTSIDNRDLASYADRYIGSDVIVGGKIFNIIDSTDLQIMLDGGNSDAVVVKTQSTFSKFYKDDEVSVYGTIGGYLNVTNAFGGNVKQAFLYDAIIVKQ